MRQLVRRHLGFFLASTAAAFALRLLFLWKFRLITGDSFVYGDIAKNWLQHGIFAMTEDGVPVPTYIRLPGYPAFLALIWKVVGPEHYTVVTVVQMFLDVGTCFLAAGLAGRVLWERAALSAFLLYALNPFTANYAATPLTETLATFFTALALLFAAEGLPLFEHRSSTVRAAGSSSTPERAKVAPSGDSGSGWGTCGLRCWVLCGVAVGAGILLRPDTGILLAGIAGYLFIQMFRRPAKRRMLSAGLLFAAVALAPLAPWTVRNWRVFHIFEPLAPRYANNPWEFVASGFNRWIKTWLVDYVSVDDVYWHVPGESLDITKLPLRAFDSAEERAHTERLFSAYNATCNPLCRMTPELDLQFAALAAQRIHRAPLRYFVWLPLARVADMWLRPRTEMLPLDSHWWSFGSDPEDSSIAMLLGAINLAYVVAGLMGVARKKVAYAGLFLLWIALRCAFLATLENPEPRYTLECFPVVCVFAAANLRRDTTAPGRPTAPADQ